MDFPTGQKDIFGYFQIMFPTPVVHGLLHFTSQDLQHYESANPASRQRLQLDEFFYLLKLKDTNVARTVLKNIGLLQFITTASVLLRLEVQESKEDMEYKKYQVRRPGHGTNDPGYISMLSDGMIHKYHTAVVLRLLEDFFQTPHVVYADSAFSSLATALALLLHGLYFTGMVKTATREFPMELLRTWAAGEFGDGVPQPNIGDFLVMTTTYNANGQQREVTAPGYISDSKKPLKTLVTTHGSTDYGNPRVICSVALSKKGKSLKLNSSSSTVQHPKALGDYYSFAHAVDDNNLLRQGILRIEESSKTQRWFTRPFSTNIGMILADAYLICYQEARYRGDESRIGMEFIPFTAMVVNRMFEIHSQIPAVNSSASARDQPTTGGVFNNVDDPHQLRCLKHHPHFVAKKAKPSDCKLRCAYCGKSCSYYCIHSYCTSDQTVCPIHDPATSEKHTMFPRTSKPRTPPQITSCK